MLVWSVANRHGSHMKHLPENSSFHRGSLRASKGQYQLFYLWTWVKRPLDLCSCYAYLSWWFQRLFSTNEYWFLFRFQINDTGAVRNAVQNFFTVAETNERIRKLYGNAVLDISSDQLIFNSRETLRKICIFLDVTCYDSYLNKVERLLNGHSTRSRNLVAWRKEDRDLITTEGAKYSFLQSFTFDDVSSFTHWIKLVV